MCCCQVFSLQIVHTIPGDDMLNSLWAENLQIPSFPALQKDLKTDVLIIGGGMAGILCAHKLARSGVDYALIEADEICHGVTRNTTAKITSQHGLCYHKLLRRFGEDKARMYYDINQMALEEFRQLASSVACDFETKSNYSFNTHSEETLEREMLALEQLRIGHAFVQKLPIPVAAGGAIRFQNQGQFHPLKLVSEIAKDLRIYAHTPAREFVGNTVLTDRGRITADKIIVATHFPILNKHGMYFLKMYQKRSYVLALENAQQVTGMYLDEGKDGFSFRNYGELLLLGGGGHRTGKSGGGWAALEEFAKKHYPDARIKYRWATQDCMSLDGVPYIGQYSKNTPNLYVATGFNKWGMTSSMAAAMILTDLVQGKPNIFADVFDPSRTMLRPQLLVNGFEAVTHLLKPTTPRCPHMGCALKWNKQEHSWDGPCHGSRFSKEGKLLDNPATADMKPHNKAADQQI